MSSSQPGRTRWDHLTDPEPTESHALPTATWSAVWVSMVWRCRMAVFGASAGAPPTAAQQRRAALVVVVALVWFAVCAALGAMLVAA